MQAPTPDRWKINDIDVPLKSMVFWLLKLMAAYLIVGLMILMTGLIVFTILWVCGVAALPNHERALPTHFADPNYWKR